jgi:hypothetical protein
VIEQHRVIAEDKLCYRLLALVRPCGHGLKVIVAGSEHSLLSRPPSVINGSERAASVVSNPMGDIPMSVTYFVVVSFDRNDEGDLVAGDAKEATNAQAAERGARELATGHAGVVAFSRTGDPETGEFENAVILAQYGDVDLNVLSV